MQSTVVAAIIYRMNRNQAKSNYLIVINYLCAGFIPFKYLGGLLALQVL